MNILITGHLGFIGTHLWTALKKHHLIGYDIKGGDDILDKRKLEYVFETENIDCVIHLAALTGARRGELYPEDYFRVNVLGTKNVVDLCVKYNVKLIHFSSSSVKQPNTIYGMSKLCGEQIAGRTGATIVRPFTVIGEYGRKDQVIYKWINSIKKNKGIAVHGLDTARNFTYVGDVVNAVKDLIGIDTLLPFMPVELCNPTSITLEELIKIFAKYYEFDVIDTGLDTYEMKENMGRWDMPFVATDAKKIIERILKNEI